MTRLEKQYYNMWVSSGGILLKRADFVAKVKVNLLNSSDLLSDLDINSSHSYLDIFSRSFTAVVLVTE